MAFWFRGAGPAALAALAALAAPARVPAIIYTVDNTADIIGTGGSSCTAVGGGCTLRAAVMAANSVSDLGIEATIVLPAGTYFLTISVVGSDGDWEGDLNLRTPGSGSPGVQIVGAGAATTIIDPGEHFRAFDVSALRTASISGVTIRNGLVPGANGGAIRNAGHLTISNSVFDLNTASQGGAIFSSSQLSVSGSVFTGNVAQQGGAIEFDGAGVVTLTATDFSSNESNLGGAVYVQGATLTVVDSVLSENSVLAGGSGGGLYAITSTLLIDRSTLSGNSAGDGGGIGSYSSNLVVRSSTFSGNHADGNGGGLSFAGPSSVANIYSTSILGNEADFDAVSGGVGGGIYNDATTVNIRNTLIAGNHTAGTPNYDDCTGTISSYGMSMFTSAASVCNIVVALGSTGYINSLATIGPLHANGGPTPTHALLAGSNAIDGTLAAYTCVNESSQPLLTDQRGVTRTLGLRCDIGAFEFNELFRDGFESQDTSHWL